VETIQPRSLEGFYFVCESEAGVGGAESREGAALIMVEQALGSGDGGQSDRHDSFKDLRDGFEADYYPEGGGGVVGSLSRLVENHPVRGF